MCSRPGPRRWTSPLATLVITLVQLACIADSASAVQGAHSPLLEARPGDGDDDLSPGKHPLGIDSDRDGFIYIPYGPAVAGSVPLMVLLHGATGRADNWEGAFSIADSLGLVLLVPDSRARTWDAIQGLFGADVKFIDQALDEVFDHVSVDPERIAIGGFSDGASYALSLGLANGDLFTHIVAFSPGFVSGVQPRGSPRVFISHGTDDQVLPIELTSRQIVPELQGLGYTLLYEEFEGRHEMPPAIARQGFGWVLGV